MKSLLTAIVFLLSAIVAEATPQVAAGEVLVGANCAVNITSPTSASSYDAGSASTIDLAGTAVSDALINSITWSNALTGGSGTASGTNSWSITAASLSTGTNTITVTCQTVTGTLGTDTIVVTQTGGASLFGGFTIPDTSGAPVPITMFTSEWQTEACARYNASPSSYPTNFTAVTSASPGNVTGARLVYYSILYRCGALTPAAADGGVISNTGDVIAHLVRQWPIDDGDTNCNFAEDNPGNDTGRWVGHECLFAFNAMWPLMTQAERDQVTETFNRAVFLESAKIWPLWGTANSTNGNHGWGNVTRNMILWGLMSYNLNYTMEATHNNALGDSSGPCNINSSNASSVVNPGDWNGLTLNICMVPQRTIAQHFISTWNDHWDTVDGVLQTTGFGLSPHGKWLCTFTGGQPPDAGHYAKYYADYIVPVLMTTTAYGRDLVSEACGFYQSMAWMFLARQTRVPVSSPHTPSTFTLQVQTMGDTQNASNPVGMEPAAVYEFGNFFRYMSRYLSHTGNLANAMRYYVASQMTIAAYWVKLIDNNQGAAGSALTAQTQPRSFYEPGSGVFIHRNTWDTSGCVIWYLQLGSQWNSHRHGDAGSWQAMRCASATQGYWLGLESVGYPGIVPIFNSTDGTDGVAADCPSGCPYRNSVQHNSVALGDFRFGAPGAKPVVRRITFGSNSTNPTWVHIATNLLPGTGLNSGLTYATHSSVQASALDQDFFIYDAWNWLVTMDRSTTASSSVVMTRVEHCQNDFPAVVSNAVTCTVGTEEARYYYGAGSLSGQSAAYTEVDETTAVSVNTCTTDKCLQQWRLEQRTTSSSTQKYGIVGRELRTAGAGDTIVTTVTEDGSNIYVTGVKGAETVIVRFPKGSTSTSGGGVTINGAAEEPFGSTVPTITVTTTGWAWS